MMFGLETIDLAEKSRVIIKDEVGVTLMFQQYSEGQYTLQRRRKTVLKTL